MDVYYDSNGCCKGDTDMNSCKEKFPACKVSQYVKRNELMDKKLNENAAKEYLERVKLSPGNANVKFHSVCKKIQKKKGFICSFPSFWEWKKHDLTRLDHHVHPSSKTFKPDNPLGHDKPMYKVLVEGVKYEIESLWNGNAHTERRRLLSTKGHHTAGFS